MRRVRALLALVLLTGCGVPSDHQRAPATTGIAVFAASSLKRSFTELGADAGTDVEFTFAGSADLLAQLTGGAVADVYASADSASMDKALAAGVVNESVPFATNALTIAVAPGNPKAINGFRDLPRVSVVTCAPQVPCGAALARIEAATGVGLDPVSEENSVADVLNKVLTGQADAGLVYGTDTRAAGPGVTAVAFPEAAEAVNTYRIAVTRNAADPAGAQRFVDLVTGPTGRAVLSRAGFGLP